MLKQYDLGCLLHTVSLIADEATGTAVIVAPPSNIGQYLAEAQTHGWQIRYVFLIHFHTDFLTGHLDLHERIGATRCFGTQALADDAFTLFCAGETQSVEGPNKWDGHSYGSNPPTPCAGACQLDEHWSSMLAFGPSPQGEGKGVQRC